MNQSHRIRLLATGLLLLATSPPVLAVNDDEVEPFGAAVVIIELTDNDIEMQLFADAFDWSQLRISDPHERMLVDTRARGRLARQGGLSELTFSSEPSHYLLDEPDYDEGVEDFLNRWPEGYYEFEARRTRGMGPLSSEAYLSHLLPALPEVTAPLEDAVVPFDVPLFISWDAVTEQYTGEDGTLPTHGDGTVSIIEYQLIVNQETPERAQPWIDGGTRPALINIPGNYTQIMIPPEVLEPDATYEIEILAIEENGNVSIGVLAFSTLPSTPLASYVDGESVEPYGAAVVIIELTDNDIEMQMFADAFDWSRLQINDPGGRLIFGTRSRGRLQRQGGLSELTFASEPSHYLDDEPDYDEEVEDFLNRWPEG